MARRRRRPQREAAPAGPGTPPSSEDEDEAPEEVSFGTARAAAEAQRQLAGEAARRHRELLKERRRRRQELFAEQKRKKLLPEALLKELRAAPPARAAETGPAAAPDKQPEAASATKREGHGPREVKKDQAGSTRSEGNYTAVHLKDQSLTGLHQQTAKDFIQSHLYGPGTNRTSANEFFSIANKKNPVKKAAVQFVDKTWGLEKKQKAAKFKKYWVATKMKSIL